MTLRLGFVGVGKWASKLAEAFRACGAEGVAYDRRSGRRATRCPYGCDEGWENAPGGDVSNVRCPQGCDAGWEYSDPDGFGGFMPWRDQLADKSIDAIIAVAPPEITTQVAMACAEAGKACMATKPLFDHPERVRAPFYVDFWRLWSADYQAASSEFRNAIMRHDQDDERRFSINLCGSGPVREFPGAFDYGPHVVAMFMDLIGSGGMAIAECRNVTYAKDGETFDVEWIGHGDRLSFRGMFGNGSLMALRSFGHPARQIYEDGLRIGSEEKPAVLQRFCQSFLNDVSEGYVDTRLLELSRRGMEELRKIREMAK